MKDLIYSRKGILNNEGFNRINRIYGDRKIHHRKEAR